MNSSQEGDRAQKWRNSVIHSLKWAAVGRLAAQTMTWATTLIVIRLLSPADYGLMASAMIVIGLAIILRDLGVIPAVVRSRDISDEELRSCKASVYLVSIATAILVFVLSFPIVDWTGEGELRPILQVFSLAFLLTPLGTIESALLRKSMQFKKISISELVAAFIASIVLLVLAILEYGVWSLVAGAFVNQVLTSVGYRISYRAKIGFNWDLRPAWRYMLFGIPASLQQLVFALTFALTNFLIGQIHGVIGLGLYSVAVDLSRLPVNKAMPIVNSVMMPAFSAVQDDMGKIRNGYLVGAGALSAFFVATLWGLAGTADAVVPLLMGEQWLAAIPLIQIISLWVPISALMHIFPSIAIATGHPKEALVQNILSLILTVLAIVFSASYGIEGCAIALGIGAILAVCNVAHRTAKILKCSMLWFFKPLAKPIVAGSAMLAVLWFLKDVGPMPAEGLTNLLVRIGCGGATYCAVFLLIARDQIAVYRQILLKR